MATTDAAPGAGPVTETGTTPPPLATEGPVASIARSPISEPFWHGLAQGHLVLPFCDDCKAPHFFPRRWCPQCWSENISWQEVESTGTVWAISTVHTAFQGISQSEIPYIVALVDLDAGVRLPGRVTESAGPVAIGSRVRLEFASDPSSELPIFRSL